MFISLSLGKHLNTLQKEESKQPPFLRDLLWTETESLLGTGHTLQVGVPVIIIKFVEPFSVPGTVLSVDLCHPPSEPQSTL